eukprot:518735-Ditylum_brightwellii.AAC.1
MATVTCRAQACTANNNNNNSQQQQQPPPAQTGTGTAGAQQQPPLAQPMQPYVNMVWGGQLLATQGMVAKKFAETAVVEQRTRTQELF